MYYYFFKISKSSAVQKFKEGEIGIELTHFLHGEEDKSRKILNVAVLSQAHGHPKGSTDCFIFWFIYVFLDLKSFCRSEVQRG